MDTRILWGQKWPSMFKVLSGRGLFKNVAHFPYGLYKEKAFKLAYKYLKKEIHSIYDTKKRRSKKKTVKKEEYPAEKVWPPKIEPIKAQPIEEGGGLVAW
jgi:hypothetical protein